MPEFKIEVEERSCQACGRKFKVMSTSQHKTCSHYCAHYGMQGRTAPKKPSIVAEKKIVNVTVQNTNQKNLDQKSRSTENLNVLQTLKKKMQEGGDTMQKTESESSNVELKTGELILNESEKPVGETITKTEKKIAQKSESAGTEEIQPVSLENSLESLKKEGLSSMHLLDKSANRLYRMMASSVTDEELEKSEERITNVNPERIAAALQCANALAQTIQVKVNIFKAVSSLTKDK